MNKDNAKDYLPLVQALADGKVIQWRNHAGSWEDSDELSDLWTPDRYRIKPEPEELWAWYDAGGTRLFVGSLEGAEAWRNRNSSPYYTVKRFVEVK
ncbi:hypothetical protein [Stenotrophomonas phage StenR_269]|nr:hypothetical protein [Stenotrophomonas phage StenR_269]